MIRDWLSEGKTLGQCIANHQHNNFQLIRLVAACMVIETHCHLLTPQDHYFDTPYRLFFLGLPSLFFVSGLLVTQSLYQSSSWKRFCWKRFLRLFPAACFAILAAAFIIGPLVTTLPLSAYFRSTDLYRYLLSCSLVHIYYDLPGVFTRSILGQDSVNSSLWTIPLEIKLYAGLLITSLLPLPRKRQILVIMILTLIILRCFFLRISLYPLLSPYVCQFLSGVLCYCYKDRIYISRNWLFIIPIVYILSIFTHTWSFFAFILIPAIVLFTAAHGARFLKKITPRPDLSYGMYVFGFPVEQLVANYLHPSGTTHLFLLTLAATTPCALISWYLVEKKAFNLKNRVR